MTITKEYLKSIGACIRGIDWFCNQPETDDIKIIERLISEKDRNTESLRDANWLICRIFDRKQKIQYAVFAAEQVIGIFEKRYTNDDRPRKAIEAAKKCIENDTEENKKAYADAAYAATAVAYAYADADADAADAAYATAATATAAAYAATAAAYAAAATATAAAYAAAAAYADAAAAATAAAATATAAAMRIKILQYGISLLRVAA
jgi:hypothetical protein